MLTNVHLAGPGQQDDMYGGFGKEDVAPALATHDLEYDPAFQVSLSSLDPVSVIVVHWLVGSSLVCITLLALRRR
jgi:hypothetical protein